MRGPIPDADPKIINNPNNKRSVTIGINHHNLRSHKKKISSLAIPRLFFILRKNAFMFYPFERYNHPCTVFQYHSY